MAVFEEGGQFEVWVGPADDLEGDDEPNIKNACIAGLGDTLEEAIENARAAVRALEQRLGEPALVRRVAPMVTIHPDRFGVEAMSRGAVVPGPLSVRSSDVAAVAARWRGLAAAQRGLADYYAWVGYPFGSADAYLDRAKIYDRMALELELEAETVRAHCSVYLGPHANHEHGHRG